MGFRIRYRHPDGRRSLSRRYASFEEAFAALTTCNDPTAEMVDSAGIVRVPTVHQPSRNFTLSLRLGLLAHAPLCAQQS
jgi:hypothetical protein